MGPQTYSTRPVTSRTCHAKTQRMERRQDEIRSDFASLHTLRLCVTGDEVRDTKRHRAEPSLVFHSPHVYDLASKCAEQLLDNRILFGGLAQPLLLITFFILL